MSARCPLKVLLLIVRPLYAQAVMPPPLAVVVSLLGRIGFVIGITVGDGVVAKRASRHAGRPGASRSKHSAPGGAAGAEGGADQYREPFRDRPTARWPQG